MQHRQLAIDFVVREDDYTVTLLRQDEIREQIFEKIRPLGFRWWLTVAFTKDEKWAT